MKYMLLIIGDETKMNTVPTVEDTGMSEEFAAYHQSLVKAGVTPDVVASSPNMPSLVNAVAQYFGRPETVGFPR